jgi:hypothetical protein
MSEDRLKLKPQSKNLLFRNKGGPKEKTTDRATLTQAILRVQTKLSASVKLTTEIPAKLDSCAIVNLSNSKHCTNIKPCHEYGLPPIQLSGIGGSTDPIRKVGLIIAIVKGRKKIAHAYILDQEIAGNKAICLIGLRTLIDWDVDLNFHMRESYRGECSALRLNAVHELKRSKTLTRLKNPARSNWFIAVHKNHPTANKRPNIASKRKADDSPTKRYDVKGRLLSKGEALVADSSRAPRPPLSKCPQKAKTQS